MKFLIAAEQYAEAFGEADAFYFKQLFARYREHYNVHDSVWLTLDSLYGREIANEVEQA